jgi:hypothetical protein
LNESVAAAYLELITPLIVAVITVDDSIFNDDIDVIVMFYYPLTVWNEQDGLLDWKSREHPNEE